MREIKFRAWDKVCKPNRIKTWEQLLAQYQLTQIFASDYFILMQFTGLHDKNGTPIYEGDIVCYNGGKTPSRAKMVVKWEDESLLYSLSAYKEAWAYELGECYPSILEVIGNMYDNPELLNEASL